MNRAAVDNADMSSPDEIAACIPDEGVAVWWLGQSGLILRGRSTTVVVDPYLTHWGGLERAYEPPFPPSALDFVDVLVATHDHLDHLDHEGFPQILEASPAATAVVPQPALAGIRELAAENADRVVGARPGEPLELNGAVLTAFPAVHANRPWEGYDFHRTPDGEYPFLGFVIEVDGVRVGHLGDTLVYEGLPEHLREADLDLLVLPINGISWFREKRGVAGNMNAFEAAELADASGARLTMPVHWDLFPWAAGDPEHFMRYAAFRHPGVRAVVPTLCGRIDVPGRKPA